MVAIESGELSTGVFQTDSLSSCCLDRDAELDPAYFYCDNNLYPEAYKPSIPAGPQP